MAAFANGDLGLITEKQRTAPTSLLLYKVSDDLVSIPLPFPR